MTGNLSDEIPFLVGADAIQRNAGGIGAGQLPVLAAADRTRFAVARRAILQDRAGYALPPGAGRSGTDQPSRSEDDAATPELVIDRANFLPACFLEVGAARARAVCKLKAEGTDYRGRSGSWSGTGFLVSRSILLTNHHVLNSIEVAAAATVIFNYQVDPQGELLTTKGFKLNPARLFATSPVGELDFAFVWVDGEPGAEFGFVQLDRSSFTVMTDEPANVVHHPSGNPKTVTLQENNVRAQDVSVLHYVSDTEPGSSGCPVFNNDWRLVALHHASRRVDGTILNEGIKVAAIAAHLERLAEGAGADSTARELLALFRGTDSVMGFFGALGRPVGEARPGVEAVVQAYRSEASDVDLAFWSVEWRTGAWQDRIDLVVDAIARLNLDLWTFERCEPQATAALLDRLSRRHGLRFEAGRPDPGPGAEAATVIWNTATLRGEARPWPEEIDAWFRVDSRAFDDLALEGEDGPVFPRHPGLFRFDAVREEGQSPYAFHLVPLHLRTPGGGRGQARQRTALRILAAAIGRTAGDPAAEPDWVIGGDFGAGLAGAEFGALARGGMAALTAGDEGQGAIACLRSPRSLVDRIYLSANMAATHGARDRTVVARDKVPPDDLLALPDRRPVLARLSLRDRVERAAAPAEAARLPPSLREALKAIGTAEEASAQRGRGSAGDGGRKGPAAAGLARRLSGASARPLRPDPAAG